MRRCSVPTRGCGRPTGASAGASRVRSAAYREVAVGQGAPVGGEDAAVLDAQLPDGTPLLRAAAAIRPRKAAPAALIGS